MENSFSALSRFALSHLEFIIAILAGLFVTVVSPALLADAGSTLNQYKSTIRSEQQPKDGDPSLPVEPAVKQSADAPVGPAIRVTAFTITGNTVLSDEQIKAVFAGYINRDLTTRQIHEAADAFMQESRKEGAFLTKVYVFPQNLDNGAVKLNVIEGHLDGMDLENDVKRVKDARIADLLVTTLQPESVITTEKFERGILLVNDLPGIAGTSNQIVPGTDVGAARLQIKTTNEKVATGDVYFDNFGGYFTGQNRLGATVSLNSPTGNAERLTAGAVISNRDTLYGFLDMNFYVLDNGLRAGVAADYLDYKTNESNGLHGDGWNVTAYTEYPFIRSRRSSLSGKLDLTHTQLNDKTDLVELTDRAIDALTGSLFYQGQDNYHGGGTTYAQVAARIGNLDLDGNEAYKAFDKQFADTQGGFSKLEASVSRLQHIQGDLQTYLALSGQVASKNLDTYESITFGGPYSMPGYYVGEVFGDEGVLAHADLRYNLYSMPWEGHLQVSAFYDYGWIDTHIQEIVGGFPVPGSVSQSYTMQSAGFGISQTWGQARLQGLIGWQINNEIPDELLADGGDSSYRGWIKAEYYF